MKKIITRALFRGFRFPIRLSVTASLAGERLVRGRQGFYVYQRRGRGRF